MSIDYDALRREWPRMKAALTRAENSGDPHQVIAVCERTLARFDEIGWPDDWARFERAKRDAEFKLALS